MRPDIEYCYAKIEPVLRKHGEAEALVRLDLLYYETKRLQGVIESFVEDQHRKERAAAKKAKKD